jgi:hypothetical protein
MVIIDDIKSCIFWAIMMCSLVKVNTFRRNVSSTSSWSKSKAMQEARMKHTADRSLLAVHFTQVSFLFFDLEHGGDMFI